MVLILSFNCEMNTFIHMTSKDGTHRGFQNVVSKFASHIAQKPKSQKTNL